MTNRGGNHAKRTMPHGIGKVAVAAPAALPLFDVQDLERARVERQELMRKLAHQRLDAHSRIRIQQKLNLIVAKIIRLELKLGGRH